ncbi:butyrophilin-like protein 2 [Anableps anableps]
MEVVESGAESVLLPCRTRPFLPGDATVEWRDGGGRTVHVYQDGSDQPGEQDQLYRTRTRMNKYLLKTGDLSLTLRRPTDGDRGLYTCRVSSRDGDVLMRKQLQNYIQNLQVLLWNCNLGSRTSLVQSVHEPVQNSRRSSCLSSPGVQVDVSSSFCQSEGNWSSVETNWTPAAGHRVQLGTVRSFLLSSLRTFCPAAAAVQEQVEVDSGAESVLLSCRATVQLPGDARVEWRDTRGRTVHVYPDGSDQPGEQNQLYRTRTRMNEDLLKTGDLSLTLRRPTYGDTNIYTCRVSSRDGDVLMKKQVQLEVKVSMVEVDSGTESVLLSWKNKVQLPGDARVEWRDIRGRKVHVYQDGSDQPGEQDQFYRTRTRMNEDLLKTGDLSLTLRRPTDGDRSLFTCSVSRRDGDVLMKKQVQLEVKDHQVEVKKGAESVLLPFTTTPELPGDTRVEWKDSRGRMVHVYQNGSDQPGEQNQLYRTRTRMNEDLLKTGDLSLTLRRPTVRDRGEFRCRVWREEGLLRWKTVQLKVKAGTVQVQPEDTRSSCGSIDPTPLMAHQSV